VRTQFSEAPKEQAKLYVRTYPDNSKKIYSKFSQRFVIGIGSSRSIKIHLGGVKMFIGICLILAGILIAMYPELLSIIVASFLIFIGVI